MNPTTGTTVTSVGLTTPAVVNYNDESNFSLLDDDDDEEIMPSIVGGTTSLSDDTDSNNAVNITTTTSKEYYDDSILQQTSKWMVELEEIRDTTTWCHVENSFHRDTFAMMDVQASFNYPSI